MLDFEIVYKLLTTDAPLWLQASSISIFILVLVFWLRKNWLDFKHKVIEVESEKKSLEVDKLRLEILELKAKLNNNPSNLNEELEKPLSSEDGENQINKGISVVVEKPDNSRLQLSSDLVLDLFAILGASIIPLPLLILFLSSWEDFTFIPIVFLFFFIWAGVGVFIRRRESVTSRAKSILIGFVSLPIIAGFIMIFLVLLNGFGLIGGA